MLIKNNLHLFTIKELTNEISIIRTRIKKLDYQGNKSQSIIDRLVYSNNINKMQEQIENRLRKI